MRGGDAFTGRTGNSYEPGGVIEVEHPDFSDAQRAGWHLAEEEPAELGNAQVEGDDAVES